MSLPRSLGESLVGLYVMLFVFAPAARAQNDSSRLTPERIFASDEFNAAPFGPARWIDDSTYVALERSKDGAEGNDIVRYDAASGRRDVMVPVSQLIAATASKPLTIEDYNFSPDKSLLLIYTNSRRVWRLNTRGDYWVLNLRTKILHQVGGNATPSTLMFAKFSPDGSRIAYVRENNLYVETAVGGYISQLTSDGSPTRANGTFDWVYEEELDLRDGFRWSPDGKKIAYWQLDMTGVKNYLLINDTDSTYSFVTPVQYPKAGSQNSAGRVGVSTSQAARQPGSAYLAIPERITSCA
jgi:dipeptidyl-peptidase-4